MALDLADVDLPTFSVHIVGKGKTEPARVPLSNPARAALADWIASRGNAPGPVFIRLDRAARGADRLTGDAVARLVKALGRKAGLAREVRPHGLRHEAITPGPGPVRGRRCCVRHFSRHAKIETLLRSDDNRRDEAGAIARLLGEDD